MEMETEVISSASTRFKSLAWIHDSPSTLACRPKGQAEATVFRGRRPHKKSRLGCGNCKRRRVKCDETKPKCEKCVQQRITCDYLKLSPPATDSKASQDSPWSSAATSSMSADLAETQLQAIIRPWRSGTSRTTSRQSPGSTLIEILHHFQSVASCTIGTPPIQQKMRTRALSLAQDSPILMNAVFAFSANHLHTLRPDDAQIRILAQHHSQITLQLYTAELNSAAHTVSKVDALIPATLLVSAIMFFTSHGAAASSFVFSDDPHAADWLSNVCGLGTLLSREAAKPARAQSSWMLLFHPGNHACLLDLSEPDSGLTLPAAFVQLCHIDQESTPETNPYVSALRLLVRMMRETANQETFSKLMQFPCRLSAAFRVLLKEKDPVALLMLAYWFAKIGEIDFWWLGTRAQNECFAICSYLDGWPDERVRELLVWPMRACGYVEIDLDLIEACVFGM